MGDGWDMSPPLSYPRGTNYVLSPPLFDPDFDFFDRPNLDFACLGRHWGKNGVKQSFLCRPAKNPRIVPPTFRDKITPMRSLHAFGVIIELYEITLY